MTHEILPENDPQLKSFIAVAKDHDFPIQNLPFGIFQTNNGQASRIGVAIGDYVLDLVALCDAGLLTTADINVFNNRYLNDFFALGKPFWRATRQTVSELLRDDCVALRDNDELRQRALISQRDVQMLLPFKVAGYTDFYSSKEHATNLGLMFRGEDNPLLPNWTHMPIAYDGRASSVVVSGTDFKRPCGQVLPADSETPIYSASQRLDTELEVGFVVGTESKQGDAINVKEAADHVFGLVLLSDWSARDIQKWEYQPLGPFLGKNFCTSISPWIVMLDALLPFRVAGPKQEPSPLKYLQCTNDWGLNLELSMSLKTPDMQSYEQISATNFRHVYWNFCQQLAHHSMNGCPMQIGDLFASGTISGAEPGTYGSLIELSWGGQTPLKLSNGEQRCFLQDGDGIQMRAWAQGQDYRVGFGKLTGTVLPANNKYEV